MLKIRGARAGLIAVLAVFGAILPFMSAANADALIYTNDQVNVKVTGGEAVAANACINDASDGVINTQINACHQVATAGNILEMEGVGIYVFNGGNCYCGLPLFSRNRVRVVLTGGLASAMNLCINDAQDGVINYQLNECQQVSTAGNIVQLMNVYVEVYQ
jgi:hypothetical protein